MAEANENHMLFYMKNSKLLSVNGGPQKGWGPRSGGSGRPKSGPGWLDRFCNLRTTIQVLTGSITLLKELGTRLTYQKKKMNCHDVTNDKSHAKYVEQASASGNGEATQRTNHHQIREENLKTIIRN